LKAVAHLRANADPITPRFSPHPAKDPKVFYVVCRGHVPGVYTSHGRKPNFRQLESGATLSTSRTGRKLASIASPDPVLYTDGPASPQLRAEQPKSLSGGPTHTLWSPVVTVPQNPENGSK